MHLESGKSDSQAPVESSREKKKKIGPVSNFSDQSKRGMAITKGCMDNFQGHWHEIEQEVPRFALKRPVWVNCRGLGSTLSKFTNLNEQSSLLTQQVGDIHGDRFSDFKYSRVTRRTR